MEASEQKKPGSVRPVGRTVSTCDRQTQTDRHRTTANSNTALAWRRADKMYPSGEKGWLGSRVVSVLDSQSRRCRVTVLGKLFTPNVSLFTKQQNW